MGLLLGEGRPDSRVPQVKTDSSGAFMLHENPQYVDDLRFALDVMNEYSHLGLDSEQASKLRHLMIEQINKAEDALKHPGVLVTSRNGADGESE